MALVVVSTLACGDTGSVDSENSSLESSSGPPKYLTLTGPAKRFCSAIWVSERVREEALYNSVLWTDQQVSDYESGRLTFNVDEERRVVTASYEGVQARARHFGDKDVSCSQNIPMGFSSLLGRSPASFPTRSPQLGRWVMCLQMNHYRMM